MTLAIFAVPFLFSGCAHTRNHKSRTASDIFFDTTEAMINIFATDDQEEQCIRDRAPAERRRKWECENLSDSELRDRDISK
jgi:hypothetical protein